MASLCRLFNGQLAGKLKLLMTAQMFRGESLATLLMDAFLKSIAKPYVKRMLGDCIRDMINSGSEFEVDPARTTNSESNTKSILDHTQQVFDNIVRCVNDCPPSLRLIFYHIKQRLSLKFPADWHLGVSGFLFLRLVCPALITPENWEIVSEVPSFKPRRGFILVSKLLQNLANRVEFGKKETYMTKFNSFLVENREKALHYINCIASFPLLTEDTAPPVLTERLVVAKRTMALRSQGSDDNENTTIDSVNPLNKPTKFSKKKVHTRYSMGSSTKSGLETDMDLDPTIVSQLSSNYEVSPERYNAAFESLVNSIFDNLDLILDNLSKRHEEEIATKLKEISTNYSKRSPTWKRAVLESPEKQCKNPNSTKMKRTYTRTPSSSISKTPTKPEEEARAVGSRDVEREDLLADLHKKINKAQREAAAIKEDNAKIQQENLQLRIKLLSVMSSSRPMPNMLSILFEEIKLQILEDFKKQVLEMITPDSLMTLVESAKQIAMNDIDEQIQNQVKQAVTEEFVKLMTVGNESYTKNLGTREETDLSPTPVIQL